MLPGPKVPADHGPSAEGADRPPQATVRASWETVDWASLAGDEGSRVHEIYTQALGQVDPAAVQQATRTLWETYDPYMVWIYLGLMGLAGIIGMIVFYFATRKALAEEAASEAAAQEGATDSGGDASDEG